MEQRIEKIKQQLQSQSYKLTSQREAIVRVLLANEKDHLSAEEVFMFVRECEPDIGLATVYRTLELLTEMKILHKMNFGDGVARYDLHTEDSEHHHHHLVCLKCGSVDEIMEDWLGPIEARVEAEYHFKIVDHRLVFHGTCFRCSGQPKPDRLI